MKETKRGKLIILEGVDGVGKTTIMDSVLKKLNESYPNEVFIKTREPGGVKLAEQIRNKIFEYGPELDKNIQFSLFHASRVIHFLDKIKPALDAGINVLCDRNYISSLVYQGIDSKIIIDVTKQLMGEYSDCIYNIILDPVDVNSLIEDKNDTNSYDRANMLEHYKNEYHNIYLKRNELEIIGTMSIVFVGRDLDINTTIIKDVIDDILNR